MSEFDPSGSGLSPDKAAEYYRNGVYFKSQGQTDKALTEFRRAVIADPQHFDSLLEIGIICRAKANSDKMFLNYANDALKKALAINLNNQEAHDQYIMVAQKMGRLEEIFEEYKALQDKHPDNDIIKKCAKNIMTLTMAMIPPQTGIQSHAGRLRKAILIISILLILSGFTLCAFGPFGKGIMKMDLSKDVMQKLLFAGIACMGLGIGGLVVRTRIK